MKTIFTLAFLLIIAFYSCKKDPTHEPTETEIIFNPNLVYGTMTDQDDNVYKTIIIGTQTWMAENLRVTKYRNGDPIPLVTSNAAWIALTTGAYCNYENTTDKDKIATYGSLYNWFVVADDRNIAPIGWHVPTDAEWTTLTNYLGGESLAGGKLKEVGITHWLIPNTSATNQSGFTVLSSGVRDGNGGTFFNKGKGGYHWIAGSGVRYIYYSFDAAVTVSKTDEYKQDGFSIRCIMD